MIGANRPPDIYDDEMGVHAWNEARARAVLAGEPEPQFEDFYELSDADNPLPDFAGGFIGPGVN